MRQALIHAISKDKQLFCYSQAGNAKKSVTIWQDLVIVK